HRCPSQNPMANPPASWYYFPELASPSAGVPRGAMSDFRIGNYKVLGTLGTGAHSSILHVVRAADSKQYALKVVNIESDDDLKFFDQSELEFKVSQKLDHPNIIKIYALETQKDWRFRVRKVHTLIEYVNGLTLDNVKQLKMAHLVQIFVHIASAMVHMHRRG